jgi:hypothetical protein
MTPRVRIGCLADHDMNQYQFTRDSKLPWDYYRPKWPVSRIIYAATIAVLSIGLLVTVAIARVG